MPNKTGTIVEPLFVRASSRVRLLRTVDLARLGRVTIVALLMLLALLVRPVTLRGQTIVPSGAANPDARSETPGIPQAVARIEQVSAGVGGAVRLDGSSSNDPASLPLNFQWTFVRVPVGSTATLTGNAAVKATFTPDRKGEYHVQLVVYNAAQASHPDLVEVTVPNTPPVADAGRDQLAGVGDTVLLDGRQSSD